MNVCSVNKQHTSEKLERDSFFFLPPPHPLVRASTKPRRRCSDIYRGGMPDAIAGATDQHGHGQVVTPEFGTSRDPLKALTSLPRGIFRWAWRSLRARRNRGWAPVEQSEQDGDGDEETPSAGGAVGIRRQGSPPPGAGGGGADFEPLEEEEGEAGARGGVVIEGLRKEFGDKVAVAGLDLRLRVGDITCLLGHNGAGESVVFFSRRFAWLEHNTARLPASSV